LSSKQYTFKTTRDTEWLEDILDSLPPQYRSEFIRAHLIQGINGTAPKQTLTRVDIPEVRHTSDTHLTDERQTSVRQDPTMKLEYHEEVDLDSKLDNMLGGM
jgi:hypothetical protein